MLKERKGQDITTKCGSMAPVDIATIWWTDVTCPDCRVLVADDGEAQAPTSS